MLRVSVVVPVKDEAGNAAALAREIHAALSSVAPESEILFVDDGSSDTTVAELLAARETIPSLRILRHAGNFGQSRAIRTGVAAANNAIVVTLDGDGQNDPADIGKLLALMDTSSPRLAMVAGQRVKRQDNFRKRFASRLGNSLRRWLLKDRARDTGCGLKAFRRAAFLELPYFDHMHRYLISLMLREGYEVRFVDVSHRARSTGRSKYGVWDRLKVGVPDLLGVVWLNRRFRGHVETKEL
jgi:glycosyltransferase involved in cell wall biosynthesis